MTEQEPEDSHLEPTGEVEVSVTEGLAARSLARLLECKAVAKSNTDAVLAALEKGTATATEWKGWIERGLYEQEREEAENLEGHA